MGDIYREENERDDEEEDGDGEGGGRQLLGFMFGNVDDAGDLDEEYLDQVLALSSLQNSSRYRSSQMSIRHC